MSKSIIALALIFVTIFVLFDAVVASGVVIAAALLMLIPREGWIAFGKAWLAMQPWIFFWSLTDF
jgi:hypothetical protein